MKIEELRSSLQNAGVVGAGGAGFPTYKKIDERTETIILNCAECEPLLKADQQLLLKHGPEIIRMLSQIAAVTGAGNIIIGIKKAYLKTVAAVLKSLELIKDSEPEISLGLLDEFYPAGDEVVLIYELTGIVILPGQLPIDQGIIVFNVETVYNIHNYLNHGHPVTDKWVTVMGEAATPSTLKIPLGVSAGEVVKAAGGSKIKEPVYYFGGPMMGYIGSEQTPITKTTNAILVLTEEHLLVRRKRKKASIEIRRASACCCQCEMCTNLCPRHLLGHPVFPHQFMRSMIYQDFKDPCLLSDISFCSSCGICENFACVQGLSPRSLMEEYKVERNLSTSYLSSFADSVCEMHGYKKGFKHREAPPIASRPVLNPGRKYKRVSMARLLCRLDLVKYKTDAPIKDTMIAASQVRLMLSQHIGVPSEPIVKAGDKVKKGQPVAVAAKEGLSVALHASVSGHISSVTGQYIEIAKGTP